MMENEDIRLSRIIATPFYGVHWDIQIGRAHV